MANIPEGVLSRDVGCDLFSSCLNCPLARCRYDGRDPWSARERRRRDRAIARARQVEGATTGEIASRFQISTRTVRRVLAAERVAG